MIKATVIADSVHHATGTRITTFELVYPRFIHSEFMTHRVFNRNASSSRAIPTSKFIEQVRNEPVMPSHWGKNQKGMQAFEELSEDQRSDAVFIWNQAASSAATYAEMLRRGQVHKQIVNRILEPFTHIRVVVTSTSWANFYGLRDHEDAQPEIRELAQAMRKAHNESVPSKLMQEHWHMPYITDNDLYVAYDFCKHHRITSDEPNDAEVYGLLLKVSAARCARASYNNFEGRPSTIEEDLGLFAKLVENQPIHASPTEHQATPMLFGDKFINNQNPLTWEQGVTSMDREGKLYSGNLLDFIQFRKLIPGETIYDN